MGHVPGGGSRAGAFFFLVTKIVPYTFEITLLLYYYYFMMTDERFISVDGEALRRLRRERALSQQDLTRITGVVQATLSDLEGGKRGARASTLRKLAEALGAQPKELMKEE